MTDLKLYMILAGCKPAGRFTEQHDVFFGIASSLKELVPHLNNFWPEAKKSLHIDAWREVRMLEGFQVSISERISASEKQDVNKLFFINLGGYKRDEFEEYHHKLLVVANNSAEAIKKAKASTFYKETGMKGAASHIDDKYAFDVDDVFAVDEILSPVFKTKYQVNVFPSNETKVDEIHLGYIQLWKIKDDL